MTRDQAMECRIGLLESCSIIIEAAERGSNLIERDQAPLASIFWTGSLPAFNRAISVKTDQSHWPNPIA
jgi:hypothetical protein